MTRHTRTDFKETGRLQQRMPHARNARAEFLRRSRNHGVTNATHAQPYACACLPPPPLRVDVSLPARHWP
eukprot:5465050-Lingulodinium_polyedra.AAC.1